MTPSETTDLMGILCEQYPREEVSPRRLQTYCELLSDLEHTRCKLAVFRLLSKSKWFPSIAEIREEYAGEETDGAAPELAWAEVLKAVQRHGRNRQPEFADARLSHAVRAIGWEAICNSSVNDSSIRAQFREAYRAAVDRSRFDIQVPEIARTADQRKRLGGTPLKASIGQIVGRE